MSVSVQHSVKDPNDTLQLLCDNSSYSCHNHIVCTESGPLLTVGHCATYNEVSNIVSVSKCPYFQKHGYNLSSSHPGKIVLPRNLSQLNDYMCGPLNRKGLVCSECTDGFGPSVTSFGYTKCVKCDNEWYRVPVFLIYEFVPVTLLYLFILVFQIRMTSPPMPCFIMYAQLVVITFIADRQLRLSLFYNKHFDIRPDMKVLLTVCGIFNLDFLKYSVLPPYCLNTNVETIHIAFLDYISAILYPIVLIFLTWVCIELHGRNFRPSVLLWRPFHRCFVRLRRGWDTKSDIIDVFITFVLLSYNKFICQALLFLHTSAILNNDYSCSKRYVSYYILEDNGVCHIIFAIFTALFCFVLILLPFLLLLYPSRTFQSCLFKCHLNSIPINTFIEKVYGCYKDGLDGGRDTRRFSSFYFFLPIFLYLIALSARYIKHGILSRYYFIGFLMLFTTLIFAFAKPYRKSFMNYLDILLLANFTLVSYTLSLQSNNPSVSEATRILIVAPIVILILYKVLKTIHDAIRYVSKSCDCKAPLKNFVEYLKKSRTFKTATEEGPLLSPTCQVPSYGTNSNNFEAINF